jgi:hypothetical protein
MRNIDRALAMAGLSQENGPGKHLLRLVDGIHRSPLSSPS